MLIINSKRLVKKLVEDVYNGEAFEAYEIITMNSKDRLTDALDLLDARIAERNGQPCNGMEAADDLAAALIRSALAGGVK